ncbi:hypothetical protein J7547_07050 [Wohlfahrtiimonas chitiniclastica]|uniref:Uncharacterized protein n=1 Tax=Wohlfahrtiimonas chitiniclastica TaxID=400946 RepID=A0AB35BYC0_9GAMM|nr:hypothetical protein [Wohlfahrtiimonas chitiniclastica]MBS7824968.1 hypothetical protein [Wohlfahrtiimonas chitiniclastica]MBS7840577.1 hypothetical protein [Wohlfahrtiimonas chitiniclastica]
MWFYLIAFLIVGFVLGRLVPKALLPVIVLSISGAWVLAFGFGWAIVTFIELSVGIAVALSVKN